MHIAKFDLAIGLRMHKGIICVGLWMGDTQTEYTNHGRILKICFLLHHRLVPNYLR